MVVILDLGDGLDQEEQMAYDREVVRLRQSSAEKVWAAGNTDGDEPAIPPGVVAFVRPDVDALSPRKTTECYSFLCAESVAVQIDEAEWFRAVVQRHAGDEHQELCVLAEVPNAVAVDKISVTHDMIWGYVNRDQVNAWFGPLDTPERIEAFLSLDYATTGKQILASELEVYRQWAEGEVWSVSALHTPTGRMASVGGCHDIYPYDYLRQVATDLAKEVSPT